MRVGVRVCVPWLIHSGLMSPCCVADPVPSIGHLVVNEMGSALPWLWPPAGRPVGKTDMQGNIGEVRGGECGAGGSESSMKASGGKQERSGWQGTS